jgi:O-antigen ligase
MRQHKETKNFRILVVSISLIFLTFTPWISKDSMVVPKVTLLFLISLFLLPTVFQESRSKFREINHKILILLTCLIFAQMILVLLVSSAPIEQQIFGKMGRGLGFITASSLLVITLAAAFFTREEYLGFFLKAIVSIFTFSSLYSLSQSYGFDFVKWETKTNSIFGTLGNPNFQSSAAAMVIIPCILLLSKNTKLFILSLVVSIVNLFVITKTVSVQGIVGLYIGVMTLLLVYFWHKNRLIFIVSLLFFTAGTIIAALAMLNQGPLRGFTYGSFTFYKSSVQSRGDFWRSAIAITNDNPLFGVGIDSFGDYYLPYRDQIAVNHTFAEFTDNAHNYFLEYSATGGYPLAILHLAVALFTLWSFIKILQKSNKFNRNIVSLFVIWIIFQAQSLISPGSISLMVVNAFITGAIIGLSRDNHDQNSKDSTSTNRVTYPKFTLKMVFVLIGFFIIFPYFNSDRQFLKALNSSSVTLLVESVSQYPQSTLKYTTVSRLLLESKVFDQSLKVSRLAIEFNPQNFSPWAHILLNPSSSVAEKLEAKRQLIELDPFNQSLKDLKIEV